MSQSPSLPADPADPLSAAANPAAAEVWRADETLHDLLMLRAELLASTDGPAPGFAPGREAALLRHLLARHRGPMPRRALVQIWREVFAATEARARTIALCEAETDSRHASSVREHFGSLTTLHVHRSTAQAIDEVRAGTAQAAALALPTEDDPAPWWTSFAYRSDPRMHVVARLPFWKRQEEAPSRVEMLVVAATAPEPSGADRSLLALEWPPEQSRGHLLAALRAAGFADARPLAFRRDARLPVAQALVDVDGFVPAADARLAAVAVADTLRPASVFGAYAVPLEEMTP